MNRRHVFGLSIVFVFSLGGCAADSSDEGANGAPPSSNPASEDTDPAMTADDAWGDPASTEAPDDAISSEAGPSQSEALNVGTFQLPFPCGEYWTGQTRTNHVPRRAVDFNHAGGDLGRRVVASASGRVRVVAHYPGGYGRWIEITHGDGYATR